MSTTIYESPENFDKTLPEQGAFNIDITYSTVWFFEHREEEGIDVRTATVPLAQLPAIYDAIGAYLDTVGRDFCTLDRTLPGKPFQWNPGT